LEKNVVSDVKVEKKKDGWEERTEMWMLSKK